MRAQDKVIQAKPDRTSVTILGHFMRWAKGTEPKRSVMLFGHGERCYNGPMRSTRVEVACGAVERIDSIAEPGMCTYAMKYSTPAACDEELLPIRYPQPGNATLAAAEGAVAESDAGGEEEGGAQGAPTAGSREKEL